MSLETYCGIVGCDLGTIEEIIQSYKTIIEEGARWHNGRAVIPRKYYRITLERLLWMREEMRDFRRINCEQK